MEILNQISELLEKDYKRVDIGDDCETFVNKYGAIFHVLHLIPIETITVEYCPSIEKAMNGYDFDPGDSFYDKTPVDTLYKQMKKEIDGVIPN